MEAGFIVIAIVLCIIGICGVVWLLNRKSTTQPKDVHGVLHVDYSDPNNGPYLFLVPEVSIEDIASEKQVVFRVSVVRQNSLK